MGLRTRDLMLVAAITTVLAGASSLASPPAAAAFNPLDPACSVVNDVSGAAGKVCKVAAHPKRVIGAGKKLLGGHVGSAAKTLLGDGGSSVAGKAAFVVGLAAVGAWVAGGAKVALKGTAAFIEKTTRPQLSSTWFSSTYWRIAGIAALLTLPFLFAAAVQALLRSDLTLLLRATLGYLPLSLLSVSIAAPLTMLLLSATDGITAVVSAAAGGAGTRFLAQLGEGAGLLSLITHSPFVSFFVGILVVAAAVVLWIEMLIRDAAIYIVVLMLPLAFSAMVWPARRVWAVRLVEMLTALILSKFVIVAILSLGGAALGQAGGSGVGGMLAGLVLVTLAAAAPWALMRLLPMTELASAAAGSLRSEAPGVRTAHALAEGNGGGASDWLGSLIREMDGQSGRDDSAAGGNAKAPRQDRAKDEERPRQAEDRENQFAAIGADAGDAADGASNGASGGASDGASSGPHPAATGDGDLPGAAQPLGDDPGPDPPLPPLTDADLGLPGPDQELIIGAEGLPPTKSGPSNGGSREAPSRPESPGAGNESNVGEDHDPLPPEQDEPGGRL